MRLSACYIVKDETDELARSLNSLKMAVDEIIVVLTGDSEATAEVARQAGALLFEFPWQNDFSKARNFALSKATGDWLICLDADEYFIHPEQVREAIEEIITAKQETDGIFIVRKEIYAVGSNEGMGFQLMTRIFRNDARLRYAGCIHEMMVWEDGHPLKLAYADNRLTINHTGYEPGRMGEKTRRNLELLESDAARNGKGLFHSFYLADCYFALGRYEEALQESLTVLRSNFVAIGFNGKCYHMAIECMRKLNLSLPGMLALAELAIVRLPDLPDFYGERGMILCGMGRMEEARISFTKAIELYENKAVEKSQESSFFSTQAAARVYHRLGELILILDSDEKMAAKYFAKAMTEDHSLPNVQRDYAKYCQKHKLISACYIVRNEEKNLSQSLESITGQVDEIIVVDTGSTDETISIAKKWGAKVLSIKWQDDFATARNAALAQATGEWILFLDADEYFSAETAANLRNVVQEQSEANLLMLYMDNIDCHTGESLLNFYAPRLYRRIDGLHYVGRIHEQLRWNDRLLEPVVFVNPTRLSLVHTGYSPELSKIKAQRNLKMLLAEIKESKTPEIFYMYLAETYDGLEQPDKALHYARLDIDSGKKNVSYASRSYKIMLRILANRPAQYAERLEIAQRACKDFPELPEFHADLAESLAYNLDFSAAVAEADRALQCYQDYHGVEPSLFSDESVSQLQHRQAVWKSVIGRMAEIKISACLIAANEEADLPGYLENTVDFRDECILIDGGSTDNTLAIAQKAGCKVIVRPWDNDFAAARNMALENATGDWALVMDADERLLTPEKVRSFLAFLSVTRPDVEAVMATIINVDEDDDGRELYRFPHIRFIKMNADLRYSGRIHEQLIKNNAKLNIYQEDYRLQIIHTGYSTLRMQRKLQRNLKLMQQEIREGGEQPTHYRYLAETYMGLGNTEKALQYALLAIEKGAATIGTSGDMYYLVWQCMSLDEEKYSWQEQYDFITLACDKYPQIPEFWGVRGILTYKKGVREQAVQFLRKAATLWKTPAADGPAMSSRFAVLADEIYWRLAELEYAAGHLDAAEKYWQMGFSANRHNTNLLDIYCRWHAQDTTDVLAERMEKLYENDEQELSFLLRFAENYGWFHLYRYWLEKLGQKLPDIYEKIMDKNAEDFFAQDFLPGMVKLMTETPVILVRLEQNPSLEARELLQKCIGLLPPELYSVWQAYKGKPIAVSTENLNRFLPAFKEWGTNEQQTAFQKLYT